MKNLSLFSREGREAERKLWAVLSRYGNNDEGAIEAFRKLLYEQDYVLIGAASAREFFTRQAAEGQADAAVLLRWFADPVARAQDKERAVAVLNGRQRYYGRNFGAFAMPPIDPSFSFKAPIDAETIDRLSREKSIKSGRPMKIDPSRLQAAFAFDAPIDIVCAAVAGQLVYVGHTAAVRNPPIRICRHCQQLFPRHRKSRFCGAECRAKFYAQAPTRAGASYQFERRILRDKAKLKLSPKRFRELVKVRIAGIRRARLAADERQRRVRFLEGLL